MTDSASGGHARPIVGGGLSPLLALLTAQQLADTVHNHSIAVERKQFLVYVGEALESLQLMLVELSQAQGHSQSQRHKRASSTPRSALLRVLGVALTVRPDMAEPGS